MGDVLRRRRPNQGDVGVVRTSLRRSTPVVATRRTRACSPPASRSTGGISRKRASGGRFRLSSAAREQYNNAVSASPATSRKDGSGLGPGPTRWGVGSDLPAWEEGRRSASRGHHGMVAGLDQNHASCSRPDAVGGQGSAGKLPKHSRDAIALHRRLLLGRLSPLARACSREYLSCGRR
jgi:hypothetical protein